ncbi:hypothetical protein DSM100238_1808 [Bifidobacterium apri]|uniref:Uncharacterized protein n=1 Tax=Bifidobacterium apri TaxID=1769423 RepID=A0A6A2VW15_9BIFI|nr:hypothetical protein DSM100238_1808 [Bifidobacterium apri]
MSITCQAWCDECGRKLFVRTRYVRGPLYCDVFMTPETAAGTARRLGWKVTSTRKRGTRTFNFTCPQCQDKEQHA